ncbi:MAG TPA: 30S ribosome-binding factor RbfA [Phototrophicaceae bacterium]|jgi:ribosome-binding factor A|nr:30S ribosome-binding factor RbfA [Phototrophicaceae bacterium]
MEFERSDRVGDLLLKVLAELLVREIRDPRVRGINLTGVKVSKDLRHARIFFSVFGAETNKSDALAGLKRATGFIRSKLGKELSLRFVPSIEFSYDETEAEAQRIESLLRAAKP